MLDYTVTFATLNCLDYTKQCLESLIQAGTKSNQIVAVDNGSTDGTQNYLNEAGLASAICNKENLSCGVAWNQGILARQSEWTIVMNNDLIVSHQFAERMIEFAIKNDLKMVSPALVDGSLDYDFNEFASSASLKMHDVMRIYSTHAVCMCIHWSVFQEIGFFRATPTLLGFEDTIFFSDIRKYGIKHATTGSVWLHHFGSVTQEYMKLQRGIPKGKVLLKVNDRKLLGQSWLERKLLRHSLRKAEQNWRNSEIKQYGMSLHGLRKNSEFHWL